MNGEGKTSTTNGEGNLVIGYDEHDIVCEPQFNPPPCNEGETELSTPYTQTGSHNLLLGTGNWFTSYGGVVGGAGNTISNRFASVFDGVGNIASGDGASVIDGIENTASGSFASVGSGEGNTASGSSASVSGGELNTSDGEEDSWIGGGFNNEIYGRRHQAQVVRQPRSSAANTSGPTLTTPLSLRRREGR